MRVQKVENLVSLYVWHTSLTLTFLSEKVAAMLYNPLSFSLSQELFMAETQQTHERMLNITNHERNANQNYNEVSSHTSQNCHHEKI